LLSVYDAWEKYELPFISAARQIRDIAKWTERKKYDECYVGAVVRLNLGTKIQGGCFVILSIFFGVAFAAAFASLCESYGGEYWPIFWEMLLPCMLIGMVVAGIAVAMGGVYFEDV
jgi:hypothetical protein